MAWCCQATSHYLSQCWPTAISLLTRPQWVKEKILPSHVLSSIIQLIWPLVVTVDTNSAGPPPHIFSSFTLTIHRDRLCEIHHQLWQKDENPPNNADYRVYQQWLSSWHFQIISRWSWKCRWHFPNSVAGNDFSHWNSIVILCIQKAWTIHHFKV